MITQLPSAGPCKYLHNYVKSLQKKEKNNIKGILLFDEFVQSFFRVT